MLLLDNLYLLETFGWDRSLSDIHEIKLCHFSDQALPDDINDIFPKAKQ